MLRDARVRLFLTSATLLFVELLLIRWVPANVVYVGFSALLSESAPASVHVARPDIAETNTRSSGGQLAAMAGTVSALVSRRRGHFRMESGYHSAWWHELQSLFDHPIQLRPFVSALAVRLSSHRPDAVCGPESGGAKLAGMIASELGVPCLVAERFETRASGMFPVAYRIPAVLRQSASERSVAIVDDAISAGSAVRGAHADLVACGARPVAVGALIVFGDAAARFAADAGLALEGIERLPLDLWLPGDCPLCAAGVALETIAAG